ncbi:MAG: alpha/beta hydrolase [bacterium]
MKKRLLLTGAFIGGVTTFMAARSAVLEFIEDFLYRHREGDLCPIDQGAEIIHINNETGLMMTGYLFKNDEATRTILMVHTQKKDASSLTAYIDYFQNLIPDANILLIDCIAHGKSDGFIRGLGVRDAKDLLCWEHYLEERFGDRHPIILMGEGTGASAALQAAVRHQDVNIQGVISIGAYMNLTDYLCGRCFRETKLPEYFSKRIIQNYIKQEIQLDIGTINLIDVVKENTVPTIFVHSRLDRDVSFRHIFPLYNNNAGECMMFPIKERYVYEMNQDEDYSKTLETFVRNYLG